jgi:hypothetical protein
LLLESYPLTSKLAFTQCCCSSKREKVGFAGEVRYGIPEILILCQQTLAFKKPFKYALMKWNNNQCEYVEVGDFKTLEKLFYYRFVKNKRRKELFEALGLKYKPISGRPNNAKLKLKLLEMAQKLKVESVECSFNKIR